MPTLGEIISIVMNILERWGIPTAIGAAIVIVVSIATLGAVTNWLQNR